MYRIDENLSARLGAVGESGMGYQLVRLEPQRQKSTEELPHFVVLNAEWAIATGPDWWPIDESDEWPFEDYVRHGRWMPVIGSDLSSNKRARTREAEPFPYTFDELKVQTHGSYPAVSGDDVFYRYSAFANDRRLSDEDGVIPSGTYLTSYGDTRFAQSGLGAVARYALPNPAPAMFRFAIGVPAGTALMCGTAAPNFGQSGGGVELRTDHAVQGARVYGPELLPEW